MDSLASTTEENSIAHRTHDILHFVKSRLTDTEQTLFADSFCLYLQYDSVTDFVINLDDVYAWLGFSRKDHAKRLLTSKFCQDIDYLINTSPSGGKGRPEDVVMMNIKTFKKFCMKADTKRADDILDYYIKLEELNLDQHITLL
jgi:hypothetical protein